MNRKPKAVLAGVLLLGLMVAFVKVVGAADQQTKTEKPSSAPKVEVETWINKTSAYLGDPLEYKVHLRSSKRFEVAVEGGGFELGKAFELLSESRNEKERQGRYEVEITLRIAPFDLGVLELPKQTLICKFADGSERKVETELVRVRVRSLVEEEARKQLKEKERQELRKQNQQAKRKQGSWIVGQGEQAPINMPDSIEELAKQDQQPQVLGQQAGGQGKTGQVAKIKLEPKPPKPPQELRLKSYWLVWLILGVAALLLVVYVVLKLKERIAAKRISKPAPPPEPAHVVALRRLNQLREEGYHIKRQIKLFCFVLSEIVREYLERRYLFPAQEYTTEEILRYIRRKYPPKLDERMVRDILEPCDLVKFAGFKLSAEECEHLLELAFELVERTKPEEQVYKEAA